MLGLVCERISVGIGGQTGRERQKRRTRKMMRVSPFPESSCHTVCFPVFYWERIFLKGKRVFLEKTLTGYSRV